MTPTPRDTPWERLEAMIEAMPTGPARTQALVDMNALLTERNAFLRQDRAALAAQPEAAGPVPSYGDLALLLVQTEEERDMWKALATTPESREEPKP